MKTEWTGKQEEARRGRVPWPLIGVLVIQAASSLRLIWSNTAFEDEALYLWVGHMEWAHWLHGAQLESFQTWFSGAPVLYPPIAAVADTVGGLAAARLLSLLFMTGVTCFLWGTAVLLEASQHDGLYTKTGSWKATQPPSPHSRRRRRRTDHAG